MKNLVHIPLNGINSIRILGKWCIVSTFDSKMGEWNFYEFNKIDTEVKKYLKSTYDLTDATVKEIAGELKKSSKKSIKYGKIDSSKDWSNKILLALNDVEPKKLIEPEWWESTLLKEYVAKYTSDKTVLKLLIESNLENVHKVLKKRDDYKDLIAEIKKKKPIKKTKSSTKKPIKKSNIDIDKKPKSKPSTTKKPIKKSNTATKKAKTSKKVDSIDSLFK